MSESAEAFYPGLLAEIYAKFQSEPVSRQDIMVLIETGRVDRWKILGGIADEVGAAEMLRPVLRRLLRHEGRGYVLKPRNTRDGANYVVSRENLNNRPVNINVRLGDDDDLTVATTTPMALQRMGDELERAIQQTAESHYSSADAYLSLDRLRDIYHRLLGLDLTEPALTEDSRRINRLIDRILQRQERRTPGYVLR